MNAHLRHNLRRFVAILMVLFAVLSGMAVFAQPTVSVSMAEGLTGESAVVSVSLSGGSEPYAGVRVRLLLPDGVSAGDVTAGPILDGFTVESSVVTTEPGDELTLLAYSIDAAFESPGMSELFAVMLDISEDAAPGIAPLEIVEASTDASNADGSAQVALAYADGAVVILQAGDTDGDTLPDDWELDNFGNLDMSVDDDADNDGRTNGQEFDDGTDPNDGTDPATVPDVSGLTETEARVAIEGAGLAVGAVTVEASVQVPAGSVFGQSPDAGVLLPLASQVDFRVSTGPGNDDFAHRVDLGNSETADGTGLNVGATAETGEPAHAWADAAASVWWSWTAPDPLPSATAVVLVQSHGSDFDTRLAVYTGSAVDGLELVAANDDADGMSTSSVGFRPAAGMSYAIAVDGVDDAEGNVALSLSVHGGAFVSGLVKTPAEEPIPGTSVTAQGPMTAQTLADANGGYELGPLVPGFYTLEAVTPEGDHGANAVDVAAEEMTTLDLVVDQTGRLAAPTNVQASDGLPDRIMVSWDAVPGAASYEVWRTDTERIEDAVLVAITEEAQFEDAIQSSSGDNTGVFRSIIGGGMEWLLLACSLAVVVGVAVHFRDSLTKGRLRNAVAAAFLVAIIVGGKCVRDPADSPIKHYWVRAVDENGPSAYSEPDMGSVE